jgi:hypothetical protein
MRPVITNRQGLVPAVLEHLEREFGKDNGGVETCSFCGFCSPSCGMDIRVLEFLETPDKDTPMLHPGVYKVEHSSVAGSSFHQLRLRNLDTGEVCLFDASMGNTDVESMVDWRGTVRWFPMRDMLFPLS